MRPMCSRIGGVLLATSTQVVEHLLATNPGSVVCLTLFSRSFRHFRLTDAYELSGGVVISLRAPR